MPDIYDKEKGLKIGLTDGDYEDYKKGKLSDEYYARRTDGSIANKVDIRPMDDDDQKELIHSDNLPVAPQRISTPPTTPARKDLTAKEYLKDADRDIAIGISEIIIDYAVDKFFCEVLPNVWHEHIIPFYYQAKEILTTKELKVDAIPPQAKENIKVAGSEVIKRKSLTQEEAVHELLKIIVGMAEIADGRKKVSEGAENLSNAGLIDRTNLLERLSDPKMLEGFNAYLASNPQLVIQNQSAFSGIFGRILIADGHYIPLAISDIKRQLDAETIQED